MGTGNPSTPDLPTHPEVPPTQITRANAKLTRLATLRAWIDRVQAGLDEEVAKLVEAAQREVQTAIEEIAELETDLAGFATTYRKPFTNNGRTKSIKLPGGTLAWVKSVLSITVDDEDALLAAIRERGWLRRFTRVTRTVVKDKLKKHIEDARTLPGLTINEPTESFSIKPTKVKLSTDTKLRVSQEDEARRSGTGVEILIID